MRVSFASATDKGLRRSTNEDNLAVRDDLGLFVVADGMGGHAAGEVASALALETLVEAVEGGQPLDEAFHLANERVHAKAKEPGKQGMVC